MPLGRIRHNDFTQDMLKEWESWERPMISGISAVRIDSALDEHADDQLEISEESSTGCCYKVTAPRVLKGLLMRLGVPITISLQNGAELDQLKFWNSILIICSLDNGPVSGSILTFLNKNFRDNMASVVCLQYYHLSRCPKLTTVYDRVNDKVRSRPVSLYSSSASHYPGGKIHNPSIAYYSERFKQDILELSSPEKASGDLPHDGERTDEWLLCDIHNIRRERSFKRTRL